jgi:hypothetical protein
VAQSVRLTGRAERPFCLVIRFPHMYYPDGYRYLLWTCGSTRWYDWSIASLQGFLQCVLLRRLPMSFIFARQRCHVIVRASKYE